jgi:hypothetical protein
MAIVALTTTDGYDLNIGSETLLMVVEETTSRKLFYDRKGRDAEVHSVNETLAAIKTEAGNLIEVTVGSDTIALNANKVVAIAAEGTGSKVFYAGKGFGLDEYITVEDPATIEGLIDAL